jgi:hypothetical protein
MADAARPAVMPRRLAVGVSGVFGVPHLAPRLAVVTDGGESLDDLRMEADRTVTRVRMAN